MFHRIVRTNAVVTSATTIFMIDMIRHWLAILSEYLGAAPYFPYLLLGTGIFYTLYLGFPQIRYFRHAIRVLKGDFDDQEAQGDTNHFQALATALSGTVGTGNIGGVASAIFLGGPAALFWMWATAFFGMATKCVEVTLSHKYRVKTDDGTMAGGPMYYMERKLGFRWLGVLFASATVISSFGSGSMPQINSIASGMHAAFQIPHWLSGVVLSGALFLVIVGGIRRIAQFTVRVVPLMAGLYVIGAIAVIIPNIDNVLPSLARIFGDVFSGSAALGGFLGANFAFAYNRGVNRGLYSNEAGQGSAPIAHASARSSEPVAEGLVSLLEPFIDTMLVCTLTGLVILASGAWTRKYENTFQFADLEIIAGNYVDKDTTEVKQLLAHLSNEVSNVKPFNGSLIVEDGIIKEPGVTVVHARSIAEGVRLSRDSYLLNEAVEVESGAIVDRSIRLQGKSLLHTVPLTSQAFSEGWLGNWGSYLVVIGLLLFAFSTAVSWSYYGDRAITYLAGPKAVAPYRYIYVAAFFLASITDTSLIWDLASVTIALMAIPNLVGMLLLHRHTKSLIRDYWTRRA